MFLSLLLREVLLWIVWLWKYFSSSDNNDSLEGMLNLVEESWVVDQNKQICPKGNPDPLVGLSLFNSFCFFTCYGWWYKLENNHDIHNALEQSKVIHV